MRQPAASFIQHLTQLPTQQGYTGDALAPLQSDQWPTILGLTPGVPHCAHDFGVLRVQPLALLPPGYWAASIKLSYVTVGPVTTTNGSKTSLSFSRATIVSFGSKPAFHIQDYLCSYSSFQLGMALSPICQLRQRSLPLNSRLLIPPVPADSLNQPLTLAKVEAAFQWLHNGRSGAMLGYCHG